MPKRYSVSLDLIENMDIIYRAITKPRSVLYIIHVKTYQNPGIYTIILWKIVCWKGVGADYYGK